MESFRKHSDAGVVYGKAKMIDANGRYIQDYPSAEFDLAKIFQTWLNPVPQPSAFFRREVYDRFDGPDETWPFCADFEYWIRVSEKFKFVYMPEYFSCMRTHPAAKSARLESLQAVELIRLCEHLTRTKRFTNSGVDPVRALQGAHFRASAHFRRSGSKIDALRSYFAYCKNAFSMPVAFYRFSRYALSMMLRRW